MVVLRPKTINTPVAWVWLLLSLWCLIRIRIVRADGRRRKHSCGKWWFWCYAQWSIVRVGCGLICALRGAIHGAAAVANQQHYHDRLGSAFGCHNAEAHHTCSKNGAKGNDDSEVCRNSPERQVSSTSFRSTARGRINIRKTTTENIKPSIKRRILSTSIK